MSHQLIIYTDGASRGNPGPGGYGVILQWGSQVKELSQGYRRTTNNRMELLAVIMALRALTKTGLDITVFTDSSYVVDAVEKKWVLGWEKTGFKGKKNADLWMQFLKEYRKHRVHFRWVRGHASNAGNNRCDQLATMAADSGDWLIDEGYENEQGKS